MSELRRPEWRIAESDWKVFRRPREIALQRFCERVLREVDRIRLDTSKTWHERYLQIYRLIKRRDSELADAFNAPRRSTALHQILLLRSRRLLEEEEFSQFSTEIRRLVGEILRNPLTGSGGNQIVGCEPAPARAAAIKYSTPHSCAAICSRPITWASVRTSCFWSSRRFMTSGIAADFSRSTSSGSSEATFVPARAWRQAM